MPNLSEVLFPYNYYCLGCLTVPILIALHQIGSKILPEITVNLEVKIETAKKVKDAWDWGFLPVTMSLFCIGYIFGPAIYELFSK